MSGIIFLLIYGRVSFQRLIKRTKTSIHASLLEAVLFRHDLRTSLKAQGKMFGFGFVYFMVAIPPILILMIPCIVILAQLELRYGSRPLKIGESTVLVVRFSDPALINDAKISHDEGIEITPPVRIPQSAEVAWRINPKSDGIHPIQIEIPSKGVSLKENIAVGKNPGVIETGSYSSWWMRLLYPSSLRLDSRSGPVRELTLRYPEAKVTLFGMRMHWIVVFAGISILAGIVASRIFHVEI